MISLKRQFAEGEDVGGARNRKGAGSAGATTTILTPATNENHIDVGDHVVTDVQKRMLTLRDAQK